METLEDRSPLQREPQKLIVFAGLPGTGKTTLACQLARRLSAVYLRVDTFEQAILHSGITDDAGTAGHLAAYALSGENVKLGTTIVADAVKTLKGMRASWLAVASAAGVPLFAIGAICPDATEHRRRVESARADIAGHMIPNWEDVIARAYDPGRVHTQRSILQPVQSTK